jgi:membrane associated rhomboid family serine protease
MGIYDRDYYREPTRPTSFGGISLWSMNTRLIAINIAVFFINAAFVQNVADQFGDVVGRVHPLNEWGFFSISTAIVHLQLWRFLTFQFLHANLTHILYNMIALFFFGPMIESYFGARRYLAFYLICGFAGPIMYMILWASGLFVHSANDEMVGASAGIFGVLIAAAQVAPYAKVLIYGILPMSLRTMAWILLAIAAYTVLSNGDNAGGQAAHLGGAAMGFLLIKYPRILSFADFRRGPRMRYRP